MRALSAAALAREQSQAEGELPDSVTITRKTLAENLTGGQSETESTLGPYDCRLAPLSVAAGMETVMYERFGTTLPFVVVMPSTVELQENDVLTINGETFEVSAVNSGQSYRVLTSAYCKKTS